MVWVVSELSEGLNSRELPVKSMSPASEQLWTTPCSLATLPVLTACWSVGLMLTLLPSLEMRSEGEAAPLVILRSENSCEAGGQTAAAAAPGVGGVVVGGSTTKVFVAVAVGKGSNGVNAMVSVPGMPLLVNVKEQGVTHGPKVRPASGPLVIVKVPGTTKGTSITPVGGGWVILRKVVAVTVWLLPTGLVAFGGVILVQNCTGGVGGLHVSPGTWAEADGA